MKPQFRGIPGGRKEFARQDAIAQRKQHRTEQQFKHLFYYVTPSSVEVQTAEITSKNIPSALSIFSDTYKQAFVIRMAVVPVDKEGKPIPTIKVGNNTWDIFTCEKVVEKAPEQNLPLAEVKPAEEATPEKAEE